MSTDRDWHIASSPLYVGAPTRVIDIYRAGSLQPQISFLANDIEHGASLAEEAISILECGQQSPQDMPAEPVRA